jgi:hypothetical protein
MSTRNIVRSKLLALGVAGLALLAGCGRNPAAPIQAPTVPPVVPPSPSVTINPLPPLSIEPGGMVAIGAIVSNGSGSAGVNWTCLPLDLCGSFSPASTDSGASTTYTAPASVPAGGYVSIVASYVYQPSATATASTVISGTASTAVLKGQYALFLTSPTGERGVTSVGGSITLDGEGNIEGGVVDIISPGLLDLKDSILPTSSNTPPLTSGYAIDVRGRGTMRLRTANGQTLDFSLALTSPSHALLAEIDGNPGSGSLDLQQHPSAGFTASEVIGRYSFTMTGTVRTSPAKKVSLGGIFAADGIRALGDGQLDINDSGMMSSSAFDGTFSAPDPDGRGTIQFSTGASFIYYIISPKALRIFEADVNLMGGSAFPQGGSVIFIAGECVYQHSGWSAAGLTVAAGQFYVPEGDNDLAGGSSDSNTGGSPANPQINAVVSGSSGVSEPDGTGVLRLVDAAGSSTFKLYVVDKSVDILDPNSSTSHFNPGAAGNALLLHTDANINGTGLLFETVDLGVASFQGSYAVQLTNSATTGSGISELDLVGATSGDGSAKFVDGLVDYDQNASFSPVAVLDAPLTGEFSPDPASSRRFTGSITIPTPSATGAYPFISPSAPTFSVSYYRISATKTFVMQTDSWANSSGYLFLQLFP